LLRLAAGAENEVDDDVKLFPSKFRLMVLKELPIPKNFFGAVRYAGFAAMENRDLMAALLKLLSREWSDETAAADEKDFHVVLFRLRPDSLYRFTA
jgi:hypothetical protein